MGIQTDQHTPTPGSEPQGTHQCFLTLQVPTGGGFVIQTWSGTWTPPAGATRHDFYRLLRDDIARNSPQFTNASVLFFDIQRNTL